MKSRAERFGIAFNPNPTSTTKSKPKPSTSTPAPVASTAPAPAAAKKEKAGAIDKAPLGISEEVLAKRAAKFGLPDKKEEKPASSVTKAKETEAVKPKSEVELTPYVIYSKVEGSADEYSEMKEKLAVEPRSLELQNPPMGQKNLSVLAMSMKRVKTDNVGRQKGQGIGECVHGMILLVVIYKWYDYDTTCTLKVVIMLVKSMLS
jgi:hypothetical protein